MATSYSRLLKTKALQSSLNSLSHIIYLNHLDIFSSLPPKCTPNLTSSHFFSPPWLLVRDDDITHPDYSSKLSSSALCSQHRSQSGPFETWVRSYSSCAQDLIMAPLSFKVKAKVLPKAYKVIYIPPPFPR